MKPSKLLISVLGVIILGIPLLFFMLMTPILLIFGQGPAGPSYDLGDDINLRDIPNVVPTEIMYQDVDKAGIIAWLEKRGSYLADEYHVNAIIAAGRRYNVHPLLLVAITGQEQSFVPRRKSNAPRVARNPFNVFGSWQRYSPGIQKSAMIAAHTVAKLSQDRPAGAHPIQWLNNRSNPRGVYATDPNWWKGVTKFFTILKDDIGS
ncbi:glucosaminidase domain-containing protein [Thermotalea metallivorans]|uniref:Mannosyl-glycoprotein endo-beta-N-acetylglucosamidase-like domain-containing protein n=1 Tax=Thermotalea metallivorans TaxID=520762 RepID=A0A140L9X6_9FIRM|nr:glucosaminidase domain-containing protein [Thermotalea metallivorans]KXG77351.1 hypothetical protein AN619_04770 [Thermotalea metallivorans]